MQGCEALGCLGSGGSRGRHLRLPATSTRDVGRATMEARTNGDQNRERGDSRRNTRRKGRENRRKDNYKDTDDTDKGDNTSKGQGQ